MNDLLGRPVPDSDAQLLEIYRERSALAARADLPLSAERKVKKALACRWQVVNDLNLEFEQLYELGV